MPQAVNVQFARAVDEFVRWREVPEHERSAAPACWWGPAFELLGAEQAMPAEWCSGLELAEGASLTEGAQVFLTSLAGQTSLPWPGDFPRRTNHTGSC